MAEDDASSSVDHGSCQPNILASHNNETAKWCRIHLFQKELTPSDVGKLNRLVIPKKFALKYFSCTLEYDKMEDDVELVFYDKGMKCWRFRYCYWGSSQSFVFTRGWNRFVKDKKLKEKDIVTFYRCIVAEHQFFFIDVTRKRSSEAITNGGQELLQEEHGFNWRVPHMIQTEETILGSSKSISNIDVPGKGVRLFGVELI